MERFLFSIPCEFPLGVSAANEIEAWAKLREWLSANAMRMVKDGERVNLADRSMITASVIPKENEDPSLLNPKIVSLEMKCHQIKIIGRSVPPDDSSMWS